MDNNTTLNSNLFTILSQMGNMGNNTMTEETQASLLNLFSYATLNIYDDDPDVQECMLTVISTLRGNKLKPFDEEQTSQFFNMYPPTVVNSALFNLNTILQTIKKLIDENNNKS